MQKYHQHYHIYGFTIQVEQPLQHLIPCSENCILDLFVWNHTLPSYLDIPEGQWFPHSKYKNGLDQIAGSLKILESAQGYILLRYSHEQEWLAFTIDPQTWQIAVQGTKYYMGGLHEAYFAGPVLGFILRLQKIVSLHASGIQIGNEAILLSGTVRAGKSTLAAALMKAGYRLITDDVAPIIEAQNKWVVIPGYGQLRLWENTIEALQLPKEHLQRVHPQQNKFYFRNLAPFTGIPQPVPIRGIFYLTERRADLTGLVFDVLSSAQALLTLETNTYARYILAPELRVHEFKVLSNFVKRFPVIAVTLPDRLDHLEKFCEELVDYSQTLNPT